MIVNVRVDTIMHATEDHAKIIQAMNDVLGMDKDMWESKELEGHYRNRIVVIGTSMRGKLAKTFLNRLGRALSGEQCQILMDTLHERTDGSTTYIRLGKQELVSGSAVLQEGDAVRIKIGIQTHGQPLQSALTDMMDLH